MDMNMGMSVAGLLVIFLLGMVLLGGIVLVVTLLANPKTRVAGGVLLAIGLAVPLIGALVAFPVSYQRASCARQEAVSQLRQAEREAFEARARHDTEVVLADPEPAEAPPPAAVAAEVSPETTGEDVPAEDSTAETARPAWVDAKPKRVGNAYQMSIMVGPYTTRLECDARLPTALDEAVAQYTEIFLGREAAAGVKLDEKYVRQKIQQEEWEETIQASFGPMTQLHVRLEFDKEVRERIDQQRRRTIVSGRLWYTSLGVAAALTLLALVFLGMKIDLATKGAFRGRLLFAAVFALLAVAACALLTVRFAAEVAPAAVGHSPSDTTVIVGEASYTLDAHGSESAAAAAEGRATSHPRWLLLGPIALLLIGTCVLLAFKKSRAIGLTLLVLVVCVGGVLFLLV